MSGIPESSKLQPNSPLQNLCARSASTDGNSICTISPAIFSPGFECLVSTHFPPGRMQHLAPRGFAGGLQIGAKAVAERGDLGLAAARRVFPLVHARAPEFARSARVAGDDVDVVVRNMVEGEGIDVLGALLLERLCQARYDACQRAGLVIGEIGQAASVPLRIDEQVAEVAADHPGRRVRNEHLLVLVQHLAHELSLIHISEPTRLGMISYAVFCLKKKKQK